MSTKSIKAYEAHCATQGRRAPKLVDITGCGSRRSTPRAVTLDVTAIKTADLWNLVELSLNDHRWSTARAGLDELGLRLDSAYERLAHRGRTGSAHGRPDGALMPTLDELHVSDEEMAPCFRPIIQDRIDWVNNQVESVRDLEILPELP